jgi:hypothetical protein
LRRDSCVTTIAAATAAATTTATAMAFPLQPFAGDVRDPELGVRFSTAPRGVVVYDTTPGIYTKQSSCKQNDGFEKDHGFGVILKTLDSPSRAQLRLRHASKARVFWWSLLVCTLIAVGSTTVGFIFARDATRGFANVLRNSLTFGGASGPVSNATILFVAPVPYLVATVPLALAVFFFAIIVRGQNFVADAFIDRLFGTGLWWLAFGTVVFFQAFVILIENYAVFVDSLFGLSISIALTAFGYAVIEHQNALYHGVYISTVAWFAWATTTLTTVLFVVSLCRYFFIASQDISGVAIAMTWLFISFLLAYWIVMTLFMTNTGALRRHFVFMWISKALLSFNVFLFFWLYAVGYIF